MSLTALIVIGLTGRYRRVRLQSASGAIGILGGELVIR